MRYTLTILSAFFLCAFCTKAVTYSDVWADNAANQYFTYKAARNGEATGYIFAHGGCPDTREIYTKNDVTTYPINVVWYDGGWDISGTFGSFATGQALTRSDVEGTLALLETNSTWSPLPAFETFVLYAPKNRLLNTVAAGDQLYTNRQRTTTYAPGSTKYFSVYAKGFQVNSIGVIVSIDAL